MAPPQVSAEDAELLRTAKSQLDAIVRLPEKQRRAPFGTWAVAQGYEAFKVGGVKSEYQAWQRSVKAKFNRRFEGLGDVAGAPELADPPQRAPTPTKAHHTPPAAQASSEQQPSAIRQCVLIPPSLLLLPSERDAQFQAQWDAREKAWTAQLQARDKAWAESLQACKALQEGWAAETAAREKEWKETWAAREKAWAAQSKWEEAWEHAQACVDKWEIPHVSLGVLLDHSVTSLAMAAFAMLVLLCLDVLAMFTSVCTLVGNLGASE